MTSEAAGASERHEDREAVGAPVERPVRPSLSEALDAWWEAAYAEGRDGRTHDTEGGAAQKALQDIWAAHQAELVATAAAERERCLNAVPDNWLDPLLTGPRSLVRATDDCRMVERLLMAVRDRIRGA